MQVGDIIRMENNQFVAADILLLSSSEPNGLCFIETAELDGETNLKCKQCLVDTSEMGQRDDLLGSFDGEIVCELPNNLLNRFDGTLSWKGNRYSLDNEKILLRGCVLRNTQWCYGVVIFAGKDSKLMQNSGKTQFKSTSIDRLLNFIIIGVGVEQMPRTASDELINELTVCAPSLPDRLFSTVHVCLLYGRLRDMGGPGGGVVSNLFAVAEHHSEGHHPGIDGDRAASLFLLCHSAEHGCANLPLRVCGSEWRLLNVRPVDTTIIISVLQVIRFVQSFLINWDEKMYDEKTQTPAKARTTTLNEELGQIQYIFSDKTGTLTQNVMTFNKCCISGQSFGDSVDSRTGEVVELADVS